MLETESAKDPNPSPSHKIVSYGYLFAFIVWGACFVYAVIHGYGFAAALSLLVTGYLGGVVGRITQEWIDFNY